jgi:hypothetical protein
MLHLFDLHFHINASVLFVAFYEQCEASVGEQDIFLFYRCHTPALSKERSIGVKTANIV